MIVLYLTVCVQSKCRKKICSFGGKTLDGDVVQDEKGVERRIFRFGCNTNRNVKKGFYLIFAGRCKVPQYW